MVRIAQDGWWYLFVVLVSAALILLHQQAAQSTLCLPRWQKISIILLRVLEDLSFLSKYSLLVPSFFVEAARRESFLIQKLDTWNTTTSPKRVQWVNAGRQAIEAEDQNTGDGGCTRCERPASRWVGWKDDPRVRNHRHTVNKTRILSLSKNCT